MKNQMGVPAAPAPAHEGEPDICKIADDVMNRHGWRGNPAWENIIKSVAVETARTYARALAASLSAKDSEIAALKDECDRLEKSCKAECAIACAAETALIEMSHRSNYFENSLKQTQGAHMVCNERAEAAESAARDMRERVEGMEELERMKQAAICTAAYANTRTSMKECLIDKTHPYWSPAYGDMIVTVNREIRERERAEVAEKQVRIAAGMLSTHPQFADQHPEVALKAIQDAALSALNKENGDG